MDIFVPIRFRTSIQLSPADLIADFEDVILQRVRTNLEGVCSRYGYIRPGSISIVKRSAGSFVKQHFNGHIKFEMVCRAEVCNPNVGAKFPAVVKNKNALGIHAESIVKNNGKEETILDIIIPKRSVGIVSTISLENIQIGDKIHVEVLGKRYQLNDKKISIIARAISEEVAPSVPVATNEAADVLRVADEEQEVDDVVACGEECGEGDDEEVVGGSEEGEEGEDEEDVRNDEEKEEGYSDQTIQQFEDDYHGGVAEEEEEYVEEELSDIEGGDSDLMSDEEGDRDDEY